MISTDKWFTVIEQPYKWVEDLKTNKIMKQSAVEWLVEQLQQNKFITESQIHLAKELEKQQQGYSEEEFKEMVYHMVGGLAQANNMTFNGAILDELFNKFKNK